MQLESQLLFFFSALGSFNGFFLASYFAFFAKERNRATYFLSALILVLSIRILKSTFIFFYSDTPELFIQIGLASCALIGPFLFLYVKEATSSKVDRSWWGHIITPILIVILFRSFYPYGDRTWNYFIIWGIYSQWLVYILFSAFHTREIFGAVFKRSRTLANHEIWLINVIIGVFVVWLAYRTVRYTSYIVGALSFSFIFYLLVLTWLFRKRKALFAADQPKYGNRRIGEKESEELNEQLNSLFDSKNLYTNPDLKLSDVANELGISNHYLSQFLNDNLRINFSDFVNSYRINAAEKMLRTEHQLTLEGIGNECGFRSNSSFYASFKKLKGMTPAQFKKSVLNPVSSDL